MGGDHCKFGARRQVVVLDEGSQCILRNPLSVRNPFISAKARLTEIE